MYGTKLEGVSGFGRLWCTRYWRVETLEPCPDSLYQKAYYDICFLLHIRITADQLSGHCTIACYVPTISSMVIVTLYIPVVYIQSRCL